MKKLFAFLLLLSMVSFYGCCCPHHHGCGHFNHQHHVVYNEPATVTETTVVHSE